MSSVVYVCAAPGYYMLQNHELLGITLPMLVKKRGCVLVADDQGEPRAVQDSRTANMRT
jgi:hypothetical protein